MNKTEYQAYLASREWAVLREAVRKRCKGKCERCKRNGMDSVHHTTYERVGREELTDLLAICDPCHEFLSGKSKHDPLAKDTKMPRKGTRYISIEMPDIDNGVQSDPSRCTVQLAARRAFPDAENILIQSGMMHVFFKTEKWVYEIPRNAACIPAMIDEGLRDKVEPIEFRVTTPHVVKLHKRVRKTQYNPARANAGPAKSAKQRSAAARMRASLKSHMKAKPGQTRFQGIGI